MYPPNPLRAVVAEARTLVPVVGPAVAAVLVFVIAILTSYLHLLGLSLFLEAWRLIQDYVNAPRIMGNP